MAVERVRARTMASDAAEALRHAIYNGNLTPGERLLEGKLAEELGCSRVPLREALKDLEAEGLIVRTPYRGSMVAEVSLRFAQEIALVRATIEPLSFELAFDEIASRATLLRQRAATAEMAENLAAGEDNQAINIHLELHRTLFRASHNQVLIDIWSSWESPLRLQFIQSRETLRDTLIPELYYKLWDQVEAGDRATASATHLKILQQLELPSTSAIVEPQPLRPVRAITADG